MYMHALRIVVCCVNGSARNKDQKLVGRFLKIGYFIGYLLLCCSIENVWEIWPIKIVFGRPNAEIGRKMASGRLLFLALKWRPRMAAMERGMMTQRASVLRTFITSLLHESAEQKAGRPRKYEGSWS